MLSSVDVIYERYIQGITERYIQGITGTMHLTDETELALNGKIVIQGPQAPSNFALQLGEFAEAIREKREPLTSGKRVVDIITIQEAALKSIETHEVVKL